MRFKAVFLFLTAASIALGAPPESDRKAILAMAGTFDVSFDFKEVVAVAPGYEPGSKPYHEDAFEVVVVAEDTPERITLQHLLVVEDSEKKPHVIKHWAQVWTWQDTHILDYSGSEGDNEWHRTEVSEEEAKGKWSQLVTSVDDTPRYESLGKWTHQSGESSWISAPTRRPLPRREYTKRDDYDYLLGTNRHTLTGTGWVHTQDNRKVVDREGKTQVLGYETGLNQYHRTENPLAKEATDWWEKNSDFWNIVRNFWLDHVEKPGPDFSYSKSHEGTTLDDQFTELQKSGATPADVTKSLTPYLTVVTK
jgi:hypothetical protein